MQKLIKNSLALGMLATLVAGANASIAFNIPAGDGKVDGINSVIIQPASFGDYSVFLGTGGTISGSFTFTSTTSVLNTLSSLRLNGFSAGSMSFSATVDGVTDILSRSGNQPLSTPASLFLGQTFTNVHFLGSTLHTVNWTATFTGNGPASYAYLTQAQFIFYESGSFAPEPGAIAVTGVGLIGLVGRRFRKGAVR